MRFCVAQAFNKVWYYGLICKIGQSLSRNVAKVWTLKKVNCQMETDGYCQAHFEFWLGGLSTGQMAEKCRHLLNKFKAHISVNIENFEEGNFIRDYQCGGELDLQTDLRDTGIISSLDLN